HRISVWLSVVVASANIGVTRNVISLLVFRSAGLNQVVFKDIGDRPVTRPVLLGSRPAGGLDTLGRMLFGQVQDSLGQHVADLRVVVLADLPLDVAFSIRANPGGPPSEPVGIPVIIGLVSRRHVGFDGGIFASGPASPVMGDAL